ncbi:MAG: hypothetical protein WC119_01295 [Synergistaceae bacterium]
MRKFLFVLVFFSIIYCSTSAEEISKLKVRPWVSLSSLWGQGGAGIKAMDKNGIEYVIPYSFVWDFEEDFTYHEISPYIGYDSYRIGLKYRRQLHQDEYSPFVGYFVPFRFHNPITIYNEAEYRMNSVVKDSDYFRTRHIFTVYASDEFREKYFIRPYVSLDSFIDWEEIRDEKIRLSFGYFLYFERVTARVYFTPWSNGTKEREWDDQNNFGASVTYKW